MDINDVIKKVNNMRSWEILELFSDRELSMLISCVDPESKDLLCIDYCDDGRIYKTEKVKLEELNKINISDYTDADVVN